MNQTQQHTKQIKRKALTIALLFAVAVQSTSPLAVFAAFQNDVTSEQTLGTEPVVSSSFSGTLIPGCPAGKDCTVLYRNNLSTGQWDPSSPLSGGADYIGTAAVRSICETSGQICREQGYQDTVCSPDAWTKSGWSSPGDNFQRDYVNGSWITYGASGGNDEYWTKITCQRDAAPVTDVCPNIDGTQATTPTGMIVDGSGNCVVPPVVSTNPTGFLDSATCSVFNGWTYDSNNSSASIGVHFYTDTPSGHVFIGDTLADGARSDVNTAENITGNHGYSFPTPTSLKDGQTHLVYAYGIDSNGGTNQLLSNSPKEISGCTTGGTGTVNRAPLAPSLAPATITGSVNVSATFTATTTDPDGDNVDYGFDWDNDGVVDNYSGYVPSGTQAQLAHTFTAAGTYPVRVSARDIQGAFSPVTTIQFTVTTIVVPPVNTAPNLPALITPATTGTAGTPIQFFVVATDPQNDNLSYGFDWSNNGVGVQYTALTVSGVGDSITRTFAAPGTYTFSVTARDAAGLSSSPITHTITISLPPVVVVGGTISAFSISPTTITSGNTALLTWSTANATLCVASGDWSGNQAVSGSFNIGTQTVSSVTTKTYTIACGNSTGTSTQSVSLTINPAGTGNPGGTISLFNVSPNPVVSGNGATLSWGSSNATLCVASGAWSGNQNTSGTFAIAPVTVFAPTNLTYTIACGNSFSTSTQSVTLVVNPTTVVATPDFSVSPVSGLITTESGITASFSAALTMAPSVNVVLPILSSNFAEGTTSVRSLTFTPANWNLAQTVIVTGQNDGILDGNVSYMVSVGASVSSDPLWNNIAAKTVSITNNDNESSGSGSGSSSGGGTVRRGGGGGGGPCVGFGCSKVGVTSTTTNNLLITFDTVRPATTGIAGPELVCPAGNFITAFLRKGIDNNPNEVRKLQYFLNTYEGANLAIDGDFNGATEAAVIALQTKHSDEILAPWGVTTAPTGIVYITTARYINKVFCAGNPTYSGNESLKDIIDNTVLYPNVDNSGQFEGVIGQATTSAGSISNVAGVFGAMSQRVIDFLKDIPWYQILILLLILIGAGLIIAPTLRRDVAVDDFYMSLIRGSSALAVGTVLNVLNTMSFILNPQWFADKAGFGLGWLLALVAINLFAMIVICLSVLIALYDKAVRASGLTK
ncbi:MAG: hypothetical protein RLZZ67_312 [Candidatus Parcubacteria bacterium]|jgi:hypothetical protein